MKFRILLTDEARNDGKKKLRTIPIAKTTSVNKKKTLVPFGNNLIKITSIHDEIAQYPSMLNDF
jgi:hypothetical protein